MYRMLVLGVAVGALTILGTVGTAEAGHRRCGYGYSVGSYAVRVPRATYYYSQPYSGYYGYYSPGISIGFGHYDSHYYGGGHYGGGHYGGGHYGGGHYGGGHYGGGHYGGGHFGGGHFGGGHH